MMNKNQQNLLSKMATGNGHGENSPYFDGWKAFEDNPFHLIDNPDGVIQMGLAENQVTNALLGSFERDEFRGELLSFTLFGYF